MEALDWEWLAYIDCSLQPKDRDRAGSKTGSDPIKILTFIEAKAIFKEPSKKIS
jgi:hypothetical protein